MIEMVAKVSLGSRGMQGMQNGVIFVICFGEEELETLNYV